MIDSIKNRFSQEPGPGEAERTLRLIASLPTPEGLEDRVQAGLNAAPRRGRILAWPAPLDAGWLRAAAAAAIVLVVGGGGWGIYARVSPGQPAHGVAGPRIAGPGEFSEGGAVRRPQTLEGPPAPPVPANIAPKPKQEQKPVVSPHKKSNASGKASARKAAPDAQ